MNRFVLPLVGFALLVVLLWGGIQRSPEKGVLQSVLIGKPAPQFELPSLTDAKQMVSPGDLKGQWYLVNVWGTWCVACQYEHGTLMEIARSGTVPILGLNWKDDDAMAIEWLAQRGDPYDLVAVDRDGSAVIDWGVYGAPETFLVNPQGIIVHRHVGAMTPLVWQRDFLPRMASDEPAPASS